MTCMTFGIEKILLGLIWIWIHLLVIGRRHEVWGRVSEQMQDHPLID